jgi:hypothetical protein
LIETEGNFPSDAKIQHGYVQNQHISKVLTSGSIAAVHPIVVIEMVACYGMPVGAEVFETCTWIGRYLELAEQLEMKTARIFRREIKIALCGSMKAKDANIRQALLDIYGPQGTKKNPGKTYGVKGDEWAALAVAHVGLEQHKAGTLQFEC